MVGQRHAPAALPSGRNPVPIVQEAAWAGPPILFQFTAILPWVI
jgi:hypothetical protein